MNIKQEIETLKGIMFSRIGLMFMAFQLPQHKETNKIRAEIKQANKDNRETDNYIRVYLKQARSYFTN